MKSINKYLYESLFDEEDMMDDIDNKVEILKWFKELTTDKLDDLKESIPGFIKAIKKNKAKQVPSIRKMDFDSNYIVISELEEKKDFGVRINIYFLKGQENGYSWKAWRISLSDLGTYRPMTECRKLRNPVDKLDFAYDTPRFYVTKKIYTFPKEWEYILNLIEQNDRS